MEKGQNKLQRGIFKLEKGQGELKKRVIKLEKGQGKLKRGIIRLEKGQGKIEDNVEEITQLFEEDIYHQHRRINRLENIHELSPLS